MGYDLITWTFDPLESRNAYLNLSKLNAVCSTYVENCYGEMDDSLNHGLPTDRLKAEWWITSSHVEEPWSMETATAKNPYDWGVSEDDFPVLLNTEWDAAGCPVLVPIPANFQSIKIRISSLRSIGALKQEGFFRSYFLRGTPWLDFKKG